MRAVLKKSNLVLSWLVLPGLLFFIGILIDQWNFFLPLLGRNPLIPTGIFILGQFIILAVVLRNFELVIISFFAILFSFLVTAGIGTYFNLSEPIGLYWIVVYCFNFIVGIYIMVDCHTHKRIIRKTNYLTGVFLPVSIFIPGFLLLLLTESPLTKYTGLVLTGFSITILCLISFQSKMYNQFFSKRIKRGMFPLTFINIIRTLWTYFVLVMGSIVIGILGLILFSLLFVDIERRKTIYHYMVFYYSRFYIWTMPMKEEIINPHNENFKSPSVIISNHQSMIDIPMVFSLYPKVIILTNDWVYRSPIFGHISKMADFYNVTAGIDAILEKIRGRVKQGYSIIVFPEGTRSKTGRLLRFHRGAFYLAEKLNLDIVPTVICGTKNSLEKGEFWGRSSDVVQWIFPRIAISDTLYGENYSKRAKYFRKYLTQEYEKIAEEYAISGFQDEI